jgi:microcystin-dependent protein
MFGGNFAPRNWALCDGQLLSIASNSALFSLLGTNFGGDGESTFGLPDLRGRVPVHAGNGPGLPSVQLGEKSGSPSTTLLTTNLPAHNHGSTGLKVGVNSNAPDSDDPSGATFAAAAEDTFREGEANAEMHSSSVTGNTDDTGNGVAFTNMQPYLGVNFIIALQGLFPSRN